MDEGAGHGMVDESYNGLLLFFLAKEFYKNWCEKGFLKECQGCQSKIVKENEYIVKYTYTYLEG